MNQRRSILMTIAILVLLSLVLTSGGALAQTSSAGGTIPYAGRLTDPDGKPVADGQYDFVFTLYASEKGDQAVWSEEQLGVSVKGGEVHTSLGASVPLPPTLSDKSATWLAVSVRRSDESDFTLLSPRQAWRTVVSAPNAVNALACPHSHFSDNWSGTAANYGLHVNNSGTGDGIRAYSASTANTYAAVYGLNTATTGGGSGVWGETASSTGIGVVGKATATTDNPNSVVGVWGEVNASGTYARGVVGWANKLTGVNYGVWGQSDSRWGTGVYGQANSSDVGCTSGVNGTCRGVYGNSDHGNGVLGRSSNGVAVFADASGTQPAVYANAQGNGTGVYINSSGTGNLIEAWTGPVSPNLRFKVSNAGNVTADGSFTSPAADMAEMLPADAGLEAGDVLAVGSKGKLSRSTQPNQASVVGVYSTKPGFVGGGGDGADLNGKVPLAVVGIVPVKVSAENGAIQPGSLLVASSLPGHAMRASINPAPGTVIGKALGTLKSGTGIVEMLVMLR
jgi:hypothetical protein